MREKPTESTLLQDQPLGEKLIKKGFRLYFFSFLIAPAGYLIKLFVSNSISVADVGVLYSIVGLIGILNTYNDLGLTESLQYFLPRFLVKKQYNYAKTSIYCSLAVQIFTAIIIACILWVGASWLAIHYFHGESAVVCLKYFCFYFLGINLFQTLQNIFIAVQDTFSQQVVEFIKQWCVVGFTMLVFFTGKASIQWYSLNWVIGLLIGIIVALILFKKKYSNELLQGKIEFEKGLVKEYVKYALWCFIGLEVGVIFGNLIQQFVVIFLGAEQAGYYTNFTSLLSIVNMVVGPIIGLIFPVVSEVIAKKDFGKLKTLYSFFYTYLPISIFLLVSFLIPLGKETGFILLGTKFSFSGTLLSYGAIFSLFSVLTWFNFSVLAGMGKIKERVKFMGIALVVSLLTLISMKWIGIYGGVLALGTGYISLRVMSFRELYNENKFSVDRLLIIKNFVLCVIMGIIVRKIKDGLFAFDDLERYRNLGKLILIAFAMAIGFSLCNFEKILMLKKELSKIKK